MRLSMHLQNWLKYMHIGAYIICSYGFALEYNSNTIPVELALYMRTFFLPVFKASSTQQSRLWISTLKTHTQHIAQANKYHASFFSHNALTNFIMRTLTTELDAAYYNNYYTKSAQLFEQSKKNTRTFHVWPVLLQQLVMQQHLNYDYSDEITICNFLKTLIFQAYIEKNKPLIFIFKAENDFITKSYHIWYESLRHALISLSYKSISNSNKQILFDYSVECNFPLVAEALLHDGYIPGIIDYEKFLYNVIINIRGLEGRITTYLQSDAPSKIIINDQINTLLESYKSMFDLVNISQHMPRAIEAYNLINTLQVNFCSQKKL